MLATSQLAILGGKLGILWPLAAVHTVPAAAPHRFLVAVIRTPVHGRTSHDFGRVVLWVFKAPWLICPIAFVIVFVLFIG